MKNIILFTSILLACGLMMTNIYNSMVDVKSWGSSIPGSIETAREYFRSVNPGNFFRVFSPANQVLALLAVILYWKSSVTIRVFLVIAFIMYILGDVFTFAYFYPRNDIMFKAVQLKDVEKLKNTWNEWKNMNWIRSLILLIGIIFSFLSLHKIYTLR